MGLKSSRGKKPLEKGKGIEQEKPLAIIARADAGKRRNYPQKKDILMNKNPISIKADSKANSDSSRIEMALKAEKEAQEKAAARMAELEKEIAKLKAEKAESKKREKATKEELASVKKTLASKLGEIDILARAMIEISSEKPAGWSKKELLKLYLEKLGLDEANEKAPLKEATLNAQCGARIAPRLEKLGYQLRRAESGMGKALYIAKAIKS